MPLQLIAHDAPALNAAGPSGALRGLSTVIGHARVAPPALPCPADLPPTPGRVHSAGRWTDERVRAKLARVLGSALAPALRSEFEWYLCRGAFFHNDAHFDGVLFGVWTLAGPPAEFAFPRLALRLDASPGNVVVFDPFEVHGVLAPGRDHYAVEDYANSETSVFVGFELSLTDSVTDAFRLSPVGAGRTLSSRTRIAAATGAFE